MEQGKAISTRCDIDMRLHGIAAKGEEFPSRPKIEKETLSIYKSLFRPKKEKEALSIYKKSVGTTEL